MPGAIRTIAVFAALALSATFIAPERCRAQDAPAPADPDPSRMALSSADLAAEAAFNRESDIVMVTVATLEGAPDGEVIGVELRDELRGATIVGDQAAQKTVAFGAMKSRKKRPKIGISIGAGVSRRGEPDIEGPREGGGGSIEGFVGVDVGKLFDRKGGFNVSLSVWSLPVTDPASHALGRWSVAIQRQSKTGVTSSVTMPAPLPLKPGAPTSACPSKTDAEDEDSDEKHEPKFTFTIIEAEGTVTVRGPQSTRWRRARPDAEFEEDYRIQTGLDSRAIILIKGTDADGNDFEYEIFVSATSQVTFTSCLVPRWVYLTGEARRAAIEAERDGRSTHIDVPFGGIRINVTRDVRRTDMRVSTPSCTSGVAG